MAEFLARVALMFLGGLALMLIVGLLHSWVTEVPTIGYLRAVGLMSLAYVFVGCLQPFTKPADK